jgi:hypothetical protein
MITYINEDEMQPENNLEIVIMVYYLPETKEKAANIHQFITVTQMRTLMPPIIIYLLK